MRKTNLLIGVLLAVGGCGIDLHVHQDDEPARGLAALPAATDEAIAAADSPEKWLNPFLVIHPEGIEVRRQGDAQNIDRGTVERTEKILLALPREAWPMGRVVAVTEQSLLSGNDEAQIAKHSLALSQMLESHGIRIERWPTA
jgi:hypothetical protein